MIEDGEVTLHDSNAILVYLAARYDTDRSWYPTDARAQAEIQIWLSKAANELANGPAAARLVTVFGAGFDHEAVRRVVWTSRPTRTSGPGWRASRPCRVSCP